MRAMGNVHPILDFQNVSVFQELLIGH